MPKCVLIVDDDHVNTLLIERTLQAGGYEVITTHDGQEALDSLKARIPDLILLDVQMPKMDGYTFIMKMLKVPEYAKIPVIVLTSMEKTGPLFNRHGIKAYLVKPLDPKTLLSKIQEALPV